MEGETSPGCGASPRDVAPAPDGPADVPPALFPLIPLDAPSPVPDPAPVHGSPTGFFSKIRRREAFGPVSLSQIFGVTPAWPFLFDLLRRL